MRKRTPVPRTIRETLVTRAAEYPVVTLTGPRQSGKTTLCRMVFPELPYANLEDPETREFALSDPKGFLSRFPEGAVIDEIQRVGKLTSSIQVLVDNPRFEGTFVLTGSRNLTVRSTVDQSLAGRTALITLLPFSYEELGRRWPGISADEALYTGFYPRIHDRGLNPTQSLADYVSTYVERDLRQLSLIRDLTVFQRFLGLCAGRIGQLLNHESLANDTGVSHATVREWLSLLETSYIAFRLPPFFRNISKRLIKSPKLYFYDVGLAAYLIGIDSPKQLDTHPLRGMLFENMIVAEVLKFLLNRGRRAGLHFYRDSSGNEVDIVIPWGAQLIPVEAKSAKTIHTEFFRGFRRFAAILEEAADGMLVYGGNDVRVQHGVSITSVAGLSETLRTRLKD
jgi:predicted AAA+ superfamily ATPase